MGRRNTPEQSRRYVAAAAERQRQAGRSRRCWWLDEQEAQEVRRLVDEIKKRRERE
jgi:hypothetical protein